MYNDRVNIVADYHDFSAAKLRHYFESCINCLWKTCKHDEKGNHYKSADYEKLHATLYGKLRDCFDYTGR